MRGTRARNIARSSKAVMIEIIIWLVFGALAGWIASMLAGTNGRQGGLANIVVGLLGAVVGGFVMRSLGGGGVTGFNLQSLLVAIGGAVILLFIFNAFRKKA